jgi:hypothetical protein
VYSILFRFLIAVALSIAWVLSLTLGGGSTVNAPPLPNRWASDTSVVPTLVNKRVISEGEDLLYEVSWTVFKIGTVRLKTLQTKLADSVQHFTAAAFIDSYEGLPFVSLHSIAYTEMDSSFTARRARSLEERSDQWWGMHYVFDLVRDQCYFEETWQNDLKAPPYRRTGLDTLKFTGRCVQDGLSLLYFARSRVHQSHKETVPIIAYGKTGSTYFNFTGRKGEQDIDAVEKPVKVVEFGGRLNIEGLFGLTGDFRGWFSDDSAAVPIKAKVKVILGSVNVELIQWHRSGWKPPQEDVTKMNQTEPNHTPSQF